jgi:molybdopterin synthase sulfur carrier subunit
MASAAEHDPRLRCQLFTRKGIAVQVHFFATLRHIVGQKSVDIEVPAEVDVQTLVEQVVARFPDLDEILLDAERRVPRGVHVFINGRGAGYLPAGFATRVTDDDRIDIFPAVAGGS